MSIRDALRAFGILLGPMLLSALTYRGAVHHAPHPSAALRGTALAVPDSQVPQERLRGFAAHLPLSFELNEGQTDPSVKFLTVSRNYALFLTPQAAVFEFSSRRNGDRERGQSASSRPAFDAPGLAQDSKPEPRIRPARAALRLSFEGANTDAAISGQDQLPGKSNYLVGNNPAAWLTGVPHFAKVRYRNIYPGVDMIYYGRQGRLEYDLVVAPGANPGSVQMALSSETIRAGKPPAVHGERAESGFRRLSSGSVRITRGGDLVASVRGAQVRFHRPQAYQWTERGGQEGQAGGGRKLVEARYVIRPGGRVGFRIGAYDGARPLVIDPALVYSTYLGGGDEDDASGIAVDRGGNIYVTGQTASLDFPVTGGAFQSSNAGSTDVFVSKLDSTGKQLLYSTYLGGSAADSGEAIAVDGSGSIYVAGTTCSADFPTTPGAFQTRYHGSGRDCELYGGDAFVTKLNSSGSAPVYSSYLGSSGSDVAYGLAVNPGGVAYVTGQAGGSNFPTTPNAYQTQTGGQYDAFVAAFKPDGSGLEYSTFLGGKSADLAYTIALDSSGDAFVGGATSSSNFPVTSGAFQERLRAPTAGFVTKLNPEGSALVYSTYFGGAGTGINPCAACVTSVALDSQGSAYVSGLTWETRFPVTPGAFQPVFAGGFHDAFVAKLNPAGTAVDYCSYLGGGDDDGAVAIVVDASGNAYLRGNTYSTDFPVTTDAYQSGSGGGSDAFLAQVSPDGKTLLYSTYLGGSGDEFGKAVRSLALRGATNPLVYISGYTDSTDFPVTSNAYQRVYAGGAEDAFVAVFRFGSSPILLPGGAGPAGAPK